MYDVLLKYWCYGNYHGTKGTGTHLMSEMWHLLACAMVKCLTPPADNGNKVILCRIKLFQSQDTVKHVVNCFMT